LTTHSALPFADVPIELLSTLLTLFPRPRTRPVPRPLALARAVDRNVEIPVDSRLARPSAQPNHASILLAGRWPLSCSSARLDHRELRTRIRLLMASGELPPGGSLANKILPGQVVRVTRVVIGRSMWGPCLTYGEADPQVSYTYADRKVVRLHAACDALWRLERDGG
jgi:hypothetical protein